MVSCTYFTILSCLLHICYFYFFTLSFVADLREVVTMSWWSSWEWKMSTILARRGNDTWEALMRPSFLSLTALSTVLVNDIFWIQFMSHLKFRITWCLRQVLHGPSGMKLAYLPFWFIFRTIQLSDDSLFSSVGDSRVPKTSTTLASLVTVHCCNLPVPNYKQLRRFSSEPRQSLTNNVPLPN